MRKPYDRLLIVCEGEKTEPQYLREIQQFYRLTTAHVQVLPGRFGTSPRQVLDYALTVFRKGDRERGIRAGEFDRIVAVFDRDEHASYHEALDRAEAQNGRLKNDGGEPVPIDAIVSVPCFELWLLLHFEDVHEPLHRNDLMRRLKVHLPDYEKGVGGHWGATQARLDDATRRAKRLAAATSPYDGTCPYTAMHELVSRLVHLKD